MDEPWYKNAFIYAVDVSKFADADGDGIGDFRGLTARVPYIASLGATCIWLLPFFPSPLKDNGYDVADYYHVHPRYGTLTDFQRFVQKAGEYGLRVMIDLVANHTSDDHPWFRAARHNPRSRFRHYYVWSDQPPPLPPDAHTAFPGLVNTVWTRDEVAGSYYFHRYYTFQPELDMTNPDVREEIRKVIDYWISLGVSGFRLDSAAMMVSRKGLVGTRLEDPYDVLREFHDYTKSLRPDAMLLGEINDQPDKLGNYFGEGRQLGTLFNFWLNAHLFVALARGEAEPIRRALESLPSIPSDGQWVNFLRNLDELDLHQLREAEREEVLQSFSDGVGQRIFGRGIRRRLAPMLGGDLARLKMAYSLLFSLPGTPLMVYGDEIGMGDDLSQEGRHAVRSPMQWSDKPHAGFAPTDVDQPIQPVIGEGPFDYRRVNVRNQLEDPDSLLCTVRRLVHLRRAHPVIGCGQWEPVETGDPAVFGHGFDGEDRQLLMLHNLSAEDRSVEVGRGLRNRRLFDLWSLSEPELDGGRLRLEAHGWRWFAAEA